MSNGYKLSLFTTSLWYDPVLQVMPYPNRTVIRINLPNMKSIAMEIANNVHKVSNRAISLSDGLMLATSVAFHPRAIEQLMIFSGDYSSSQEGDILTAFSNQLYRCGTLPWECHEVVKLIYYAIFFKRKLIFQGMTCAECQ